MYHRGDRAGWTQVGAHHDGVVDAAEGEPGISHLGAEEGGVGLEVAEEVGAAVKHVEDGDRRGRHGGCQGVAEEVRPAPLPQQRHDVTAAGRVAARRAAECLAEGRVDDVHLHGTCMRHMRRSSRGGAAGSRGVSVARAGIERAG